MSPNLCDQAQTSLLVYTLVLMMINKPVCLRDNTVSSVCINSLLNLHFQVTIPIRPEASTTVYCIICFPLFQKIFWKKFPSTLVYRNRDSLVGVFFHLKKDTRFKKCPITLIIVLNQNIFPLRSSWNTL